MVKKVQHEYRPNDIRLGLHIEIQVCQLELLRQAVVPNLKVFYDLQEGRLWGPDVSLSFFVPDDPFSVQQTVKQWDWRLLHTYLRTFVLTNAR